MHIYWVSFPSTSVIRYGLKTLLCKFTTPAPFAIIIIPLTMHIHTSKLGRFAGWNVAMMLVIASGHDSGIVCNVNAASWNKKIHLQKLKDLWIWKELFGLWNCQCSTCQKFQEYVCTFVHACEMLRQKCTVVSHYLYLVKHYKWGEWGGGEGLLL